MESKTLEVYSAENTSNWDYFYARANKRRQAKGRDQFGNYISPIFPRRQENAISKYERDIPAHKEANCEFNKSTETSGISEDFTKCAVKSFEKTFDISNRCIAQDFVLAHNPKKNRSEREKNRALLDYWESLEWYNICRNCHSPIKTRKCTIYGNDTIVADIPAHWEVYYDTEKEGYKYRFVEKEVCFNKRCECIYRDIRKDERRREVRETNFLM